MFKVHERFNDRVTWIRLREITTVYRMDGDDCTVIVCKHGVHFYVTESVEEILEAIKNEV